VQRLAPSARAAAKPRACSSALRSVAHVFSLQPKVTADSRPTTAQRRARAPRLVSSDSNLVFEMKALEAHAPEPCPRDPSPFRATSPKRLPPPARAQRRSREHGLGGRSAARSPRSGRAPTGASVSLRRVARGQVGVAPPCSARRLRRLRASCLPQIPCSAAAACARNGGGRRFAR
jgi:hypothetical protein